MNNQPVAWMGKDYDGLKTDLYFDAERNKLPYRLYETATPLYTHPVKELTDEEIGDFTHRMVLCCGVHPNSADINVLGLKFIVEEILRKAQEK